MWAVGNNLNRAYDYFQDFCKCLTIFIKALKLQKNRERVTNRKERERKARGHLPGWPGPSGLCQSSPTSASRQRRDTAMPPCSPRHLPACLPSPTPARRLESPLRHRPDPVDTSHAPLPLSLALSHDGRRYRSRTIAIAVLSVVSVPRHRF